MKLSQQQETEARKAYEVYFESYIKGDITSIESMLENNYNQIGSAESEVFFNKEDALKFLHETIDQVAGKTEIRNRTIKVDPLKEYILVTDLFDIYVLIEDDWAFYSKFRASTLMQKISGQWKFVHQHSSVPDLKAQEGENIAIEKISKENLELRDAIKRRTIELEHKNRELEIEAALERVRTKTMAMHNSDDVGATVVTLFDEVLKLGLDKSIRCGIGILDKETDHMETWSATSSPDGEVDLKMGLLDMRIHPMLIGLKKAWDTSKSDYQYDYIGDDVLKYYEALNNEPEYPFQIDLNSLPENEYHRSFFYSEGILFAFAPNPISEEAASVLTRFAGVFGQTYRRYLDLKKAEAQAREAQIEVSLERVRAKAMAMQHSDELNELMGIVFSELTKLDLILTRSIIMMFEEELQGARWWMANSEMPMNPMNFFIQHHEYSPYLAYVNAWENRLEYWQYELGGKDKVEWDDFVFKETELSQLPKSVIEGMMKPEKVIISASFNKFGCLSVASLEPLTEEHSSILIRFTKVFEQTYTRFLDLQNAEVQARQAKIELGLERVRARAMAMRESSELSEVISTVFYELTKLDFSLKRTMLWLFNENPNEFELWMANSEVNNTPGSLHSAVIHPYHQKLFKAWKERKEKWVYELKGNDKKQLDEYLFNKTIAAQLPEAVKAGIKAPERIINSFSFHNFGGLQADGLEELTEENLDILYRFSKEFDLTYTRFLDLKKAENQAREAQIEAALERVRSRTIGMQHSRELKEAANLLFHQVKELGVNVWSTGYGIWQKDKKATTLWMSSEDIIQKPFTYPHTEDPVSIRFSEAGEKGESFYVEEMGGEALKSHYEYMRKLPMVGEMLEDILKAGFDVPTFQVFHVAYFSYGYLLFITYEPCHEAHSIFKRFAKVFEQTYTRFLDLQKAEAQTKEAVKQSSLDRIRAEIASMRTTNDLNRITPLIWRELTTLDVPFFRCGVFIVDDNTKKLNVYLSNPSGDHLAAWNTEYESIPLFKATVDHWEKQIVYRDEWNQKQFIQFTKSLIDHGLIDNQDNFQAGMDAPDFLALQMVPFEQGMLYVGSSQKLDNEQVELVQSLADSFSVAYARYEDFKKLEEAKGRVENTLSDLKSAQNQLIQSEKMASLGELTAGIAHEIQNPLNFVNNFSEVNAELAEELREEIKNGNLEEADSIAKDIVENENKIKHHGKRAEGIVKGMLQHSRTNTGTKELTDINVLADEYLRLAYHGLRAKDKSFNADFNLEIDENMPKIKVIPQDIGRVLLNLINNAFYAVDKKAKEGIDGYKPEVIVGTKKLDHKIEISVKDNGEGIPEQVRAKIFQPFFTTKPTGSGTGLGLSLSYDIVKAHGGQIIVNSREREGTEFIIEID